MGNLGAIGGVSSGDVIETLEGDRTASLKEAGVDEAEGVREFKTTDFQTPEQVLDLLLDQAHLSEDDDNEDVRALARRIVKGSRGKELCRFAQLIVGVHELLRGGLDSYLVARRKGESSAVDVSVAYLKERVRGAMGKEADDERLAQVDAFANATGKWVGKINNASTKNLNWLVAKVVDFKFEVERAVYHDSGIEF